MKSRTVIKIISCFFACIMLFSAVMIITEISKLRQDKSDFKNLADVVNSSETTENDNTLQASSRNLLPLFKKNSDCIGWICIPDTAVDYPVMYTPQEPQKYLHRNFDGEYSVSGVPFLDGASVPECDNLIIYGHNMRNGTMFSDVTNYKDKAYCEKHPFIEYETADGLKIYQVFAVVCLKKTDEWYSFSYFESEEQYQNAIAKIKDRTLYDTGIEPQYKEQMLTLSTCFGGSRDSRIIVIGVEKSE